MHPVIQALKTWGPAAIWAAVLFLLSEVSPDVAGGGLEINDKVMHLGLYSILGAALAWAGWRSKRVPVFVLILVGMAYGASDEWHQGFVPGRYPSWGDLLADCVGVILGFLVLLSLLRGRKRPGLVEEQN